FRAWAANAACAAAFPNLEAEFREVLGRADRGALRGLIPDPAGRSPTLTGRGGLNALQLDPEQQLGRSSAAARAYHLPGRHATSGGCHSRVPPGARRRNQLRQAPLGDAERRRATYVRETC